MKIKYFNRLSQKFETESVYGEMAVKLLYGLRASKILWPLVSGKMFSKCYGHMQNRQGSQSKVAPFVKKFNINLDDYLPTTSNSNTPYNTFNEFFTRKFRPGVRTFDENITKLPAFCEARYFGYKNIDENVIFPVKGQFLNGKAVLENEKWSELFNQGPMLLARLCPVDYHRFHYPDKGETLESYQRKGPLHSVNPLALNKYPKVLCTNERQVSILKTENFGHLAYVEVGATCVGKIVQTHTESKFKRGDEKGMFLFGASTVIVFGEKGKWQPSEDILQNTSDKIETWVPLGSPVGIKNNF